MSRAIIYLVIIVAVLLAVVPLVSIVSGADIPGLDVTTISALNFLGWSIVLTLIAWRHDLKKTVVAICGRFGLPHQNQSLEVLLENLFHEFSRRNESLSMNLLERKISTDEELSRSLERIVGLSMSLLDGESAELSLFDRDSGMYHSSFVVGKPFRTSAQAMLSGAADREDLYVSPDVMIQPIAFAGAILGSLRVALKKGRLPTVGDKQIMALLALQGGLAIVNAQYTKQLLRMKAASEESVRAKTGFLANLSHELRGPLGIMTNAVEIVLDGLCGPVSEEQAETLQMIKSNGSHLLELINDVLDYAKIESGKISVNPSEVLLNEILKDVTAVVRNQAESKSHKLSFKPSEDVLAIECDRRHFRQILINLLTNAIKYTPDGGSIDVWAERMPGNKIKISVRDTGIGIDSSEREKVFSAFERVENSYSITQMGTGLGMTLTKKLVEVNGGQIDFESVPGEGSQFWVHFPAIEMSDLSRAADEEQELDHAKGGGDALLLVQKDDGERKMLTRYLSHIGYGVIPAATETDAITILRDRSARLVLIDNDIVDDPKNDVISAIRDTAKESSLPVILISSRAFVFDIRKYLRAGIDRCLIKPLELKELGHTCRDLIDGKFEGAVVDENLLEGEVGDANVDDDRTPRFKQSRNEEIIH